MNVVFLTVSRIRDIKTRGIYTDLMRKFRDEGHNVYIVSPVERQFNINTQLNFIDGVHILNVKTLNIQKTNIIEKTISTLLLEKQFTKAIKKYLNNISFDLILYSTPPITLNGVISYLKKKNHNAISYLLLKDIFPQNAVDLGMFSKNSIPYLIFRNKEKNLYRNSDFIGCMSPANVDFVLRHNSWIDRNKVEIAPNSIELNHQSIKICKNEIRKKYNLPTNVPVLIYGGNLGKPQGIDFLIKCLDENKYRKDCHIVIVGSGTEYNKLNEWFFNNNPTSVSLLSKMNKDEYDTLVAACDIGLIFLDSRFTIPNFPSRLLSYLEYKMPIIAATDRNTDIGYIAEKNGFGYWCESVNVKDFNNCLRKIIESSELICKMGENGYNFLLKNYLVKHTYNVIIQHINKV